MNDITFNNKGEMTVWSDEWSGDTAPFLYIIITENNQNKKQISRYLLWESKRDAGKITAQIGNFCAEDYRS